MNMPSMDEAGKATAPTAASARVDALNSTKAPNGRSFEECHDELQREFNVRERCFPKWVQDGRLSKSDAKDRIERLGGALYFFKLALDGALPF